MSEQPDATLVPSSLDCWRTYWRWEWFEQPAQIRDYQNHLGELPALTAALCQERGMKTVVDAACGFGLTSILLDRSGLQVVGADPCDYCVNVGLRLCKQLTNKVFELQCMKYADLGVMFGYEYYDCVMFSRLCDVVTRADMEGALQGCFDVLRPGGILIWPGLGVDTDATAAGDQLLLDGSLVRTHELITVRHRAEVKLKLTHLLARSQGTNYLDEHHLYLVEPDGQGPTLQSAVIRRPYYWHGRAMAELLAAKGFTDFQTVERTVGGKTMRANLAVRGVDAA